MTIQFSKQPIAVLSDGLSKMGSGLVRRLVCARDDPGKERIRMWLIDLDDTSTTVGPRPDNRRHCRPAHWYENSIALALKKTILGEHDVK